jgi:hypothetical protein
MAFIAELNLPGIESNSNQRRPAQWLYAGMLISVELAYGTPAIVLEDDHRCMTMLLADATTEALRTHSREFLHFVS